MSATMIDESCLRSPKDPEAALSLPSWLFAPAIRRFARSRFVRVLCVVGNCGLLLLGFLARLSGGPVNDPAH